ncbi:MAG: ClbS/DfsB family four-helix bundle protein [Deinococcota bacterium]
MPRPTNKADLVQQIETNYAKLQSLVSELSEEEMVGPNVTTKWTTKDVLAHLTEWTHMVLSWHDTGLRGETPAMPAEGFNWRQIPALNQQIFEAHKDDALEDVQATFAQSYEAILELVTSLSEDALFTRSHFDWTGNNNIATYLISASCSHYDWAHKRIKRTLRPGRRKKKAA